MYPALRLQQGRLQIVGIHQRTPNIPASFLPTCWPPSPCAQLSCARTTTGPPPHPAAFSRQRACPPPSWVDGGRATAGGSHVHATSIDQVGGQLYPDSLATPTPQTFSVASSPTDLLGVGVDPSGYLTGHALHPGPYPPGLSRHSSYGGFNHWFIYVPPSGLACRTQPVWQSQTVPALSGLLPPSPAFPRFRLPPASSCCCDSTTAKVSHLP